MSAPVPELQRLRQLLTVRDHSGFLDAFVAIADCERLRNHGDFLKALGGEGLCILLDDKEGLSQELAERYSVLLLEGEVIAPRELVQRLATLLASPQLLSFAASIDRPKVQPDSDTRLRDGAGSGATRAPFLQVRRVVQLMQMFIGDGLHSDAKGICRSVFHSHQERTFLRALSLRFPGLLALPNYPLDQIVDLDRIKVMNSEIASYARNCRLDAVLIIPDEGDPVAAFELDSRLHDHPEMMRRDATKNTLMSVTGLPFFRLRPESPESISVDEWYALLSDQVLPHIDLGSRIRCRKTAYSLIPC